jgi:succinyl-CoA synthetase beta subunit
LEHEGKALLAAEGVAIPDGTVARTAADAEAAAARIGGRVAVKAQVPTGGRGKAGGIRVVDASEARSAADGLLGAEVRGFLVNELLIEQALPAARELYAGIAVEPRSRMPVLLIGANGGVDVEEGAETIARVTYQLSRGLRPDHVWTAAAEAGLDAETTRRLVPVAQALSRVFASQRAQLVEANPVLDCGEDGLIAADVRVVRDPALTPESASDARHAESRELGFDYVTIDPQGEVGLITTGAGASMMLIDLLSDAGLKPIDFCDIRTGTMRGDGTRLRFVLEDLVSRPTLKVIAVNVFAGVTDLSEFVGLLLDALDTTAPGVPIVVRVEGRGAEGAREKLAAAGIPAVLSPEELVEQIAVSAAAGRVATNGGQR